jgi:SAM-dependent methyltransferase
MHANLRLAFLYGLTIFLSAFLLFQVQPLIGKMILPWFGGSASVWTTCMLFFQTLLLLGYLYSHWIVRFLTPRRQSLLHISLLLVSLLVLPLAPSDAWRPTGAENPTGRILLLLAATIGLPYFVLSTTGPLIQAWFARERPGMVPYRLFALSNFGSLLALLAYPVAVEPNLPTRWQSYVWSGLFVAFALLCSLLAWHGRHGQPAHAAAHPDAAPPPSFGTLLTWVALAACPSILLVADTSYLTENIAPIPLLWVVPLALYLLSFIFCFERKGWYQRRIFLPLLVAGLLTMAVLPLLGVSTLPVLLAIGLNLASFFVACMVCHGELARMQPHPSHLTGYYLMLATGGALGGFFVGVIAPYTFNSNYELSIGLIATTLVVNLVVIDGHRFSTPLRRRLGLLGGAAVTLAVAAVSVAYHVDELEGARATARNFYGTLKVFDGGEGRDSRRSLLHGQIIHGRQFTAPGREDETTAYYSRDGGAGRTLLAKAAQGPLHVGVIGLGVGTLAAYGRTGDRYRLYEIDPLVIDLAKSHFSFLSRTRAQTEMVLGDARLSLDREPDQQFDVLVADAFSGDAVPIHLLTREAFATYFRHLKPDGVLAIHVTNRFLDLPPVVKAAADSFGRATRIVSIEGDPDRLVFRSSWMLVSADPAFFDRPQLRGVAAEVPARPGFAVWRDDYSSVFAVLK